MGIIKNNHHPENSASSINEATIAPTTPAVAIR